ncbi:MAG: hypothetical protein FWD56_00235 [Bacteroidales bacterium]|nr:hypothetical protein [Bacteroidales bacterium]
MKRIASINLTIIAAIVVIAAVCTSCKSKGDGDVKLLETIVSEDGSITKFEYDDQNRIVKMLVYDDGELMGTQTITYKGNNLVSYVFSFDESLWDYWGEVPDMHAERFGNTIYVNDGGSEYTIILNDEGYIVEYKSEHPMAGVSVNRYQYADGRLTKVVEEGRVREIKYDNKKSPFYHCNTPKWFMQYRFFDFAFENNITGWKIVEGSTDHQYEYENEYKYDRDGFPTKLTKTERTMYDNEEGYVSTIITTFTYHSL